MKNTIFIFSLFTTFIVNAQVLGYLDFGVLATDENLQSTARTMAMKNAFGALGGDVSATVINPASAAVYNYSVINLSLGNNTYTTNANYYNTESDLSYDIFSVSQGGGVLLFDVEDEASDWKKFALGINIQTQNNFNNSWKAQGVGLPTWVQNPSGDISYTQVEYQKFKNETSGLHTAMNFSLSVAYTDNLFLGVGLNTHNIEFHERSIRDERSIDTSSNWVEGHERFWQDVEADGMSFSLGAILKVSDAIRLGISYATPTWYDVVEENNIFAEDEDDFMGYYRVTYSDEEGAFYNSDTKVQAYDYTLRTPSKTTASIAYVFGKSGLISADFSTKNYKGIHLKPGIEFEDVNSDISNLLRNTYAVNLGTEWRVKKLSLRGGYSFEKAAYSGALASDNKQGYALGLGYDFGGFVFDVVYDYNENTDYFNFYPDFNDIQGAELNQSNTKISASISLKF